MGWVTPFSPGKRLMLYTEEVFEISVGGGGIPPPTQFRTLPTRISRVRTQGVHCIDTASLGYSTRQSNLPVAMYRRATEKPARTRHWGSTCRRGAPDRLARKASAA